MYKKLFLRKKVNIVDGDNRKDACPIELKEVLENILNNGMSLYGIQIFHYAAIHYTTRWNNYPARFLNALFNSAASIQNNGSTLCLNKNEEPELQRDSSEVLGIGLSNMFMCRWYGVNINKVEKIEGSGKRCDYRFGYNGEVIVFESKGRANSTQIKSALQDCISKKENYSGDIKYSTICHLPRNSSPVTLHLYDPPINGDRLNYNEHYVMAKHYKRITELAGLTILSSTIGKRIKQYEQTGEWDTSPLEKSNVMKIGVNIIIGRNTFWTRENHEYFGNGDNKIYIRFGLEKKIIDLLENWDVSRLANISYDEFISIEEGISVLRDGSIFIIGNNNF